MQKGIKSNSPSKWEKLGAPGEAMWIPGELTHILQTDAGVTEEAPASAKTQGSEGGAGGVVAAVSRG